MSALLIATSAEGLDLGVSIGGIDASVGIGSDGIDVGAGVGDLEVDAGVGAGGVDAGVSTGGGGTTNEPAQPQPSDPDPSSPNQPVDTGGGAGGTAQPPTGGAAGGSGAGNPSSGGETSPMQGGQPPQLDGGNGSQASAAPQQRLAALPPSSGVGYDGMIDFTRVAFAAAPNSGVGPSEALRHDIEGSPRLLGFLRQYGYGVKDVVGIEFLPDGSTRIVVARLASTDSEDTSDDAGTQPATAEDSVVPDVLSQFAMSEPVRVRGTVSTVEALASAFCIGSTNTRFDPGLDLGSPYDDVLPKHDIERDALAGFAKIFDAPGYETLTNNVVQSADLTRRAVVDAWWWMPERVEVAEACLPPSALIAAR